jgi:hypothetical protein
LTQHFGWRGGRNSMAAPASFFPILFLFQIKDSCSYA